MLTEKSGRNYLLKLAIEVTSDLSLFLSLFKPIRPGEAITIPNPIKRMGLVVCVLQPDVISPG